MSYVLEGSALSDFLSVHVNGYFQAVPFSVFCSCSFFALVERVLSFVISPERTDKVE